MKSESTSAEGVVSSADSAKEIKKQWRVHALVFAVGLGLALTANPSAHAQTFRVLFNFTGGESGATPYATLIGVNGNFYGTTGYGGI
jgi:hypothetical protein